MKNRLFFCFLILSSFFGVACSSVPTLGVDRVRRVVLEVKDLPFSLNGYRIGFISDIHLGNRFEKERFERVIRALSSEEVDLLVLGGDYTLSRNELDEFAHSVKDLQAPEGVYAILGNHDYYNDRAYSVEVLRKSGLVVLEESAILSPRGVLIGGFGDYEDEYPALVFFEDLLSSLQISDKEIFFSILLTHNPDFAEEPFFKNTGFFNLLLAGHTHGGQIAFFNFAPYTRSRYGQKYRSGLVRQKGIDEKFIFVTQGAGYGGDGLLRFRFGVLSEYVVLELQGRAP